MHNDVRTEAHDPKVPAILNGSRYKVVCSAIENIVPQTRHAKYGIFPRCPKSMPGPLHTEQGSNSSMSWSTRFPSLPDAKMTRGCA